MWCYLVARDFTQSTQSQAACWDDSIVESRHRMSERVNTVSHSRVFTRFLMR